MTRPGLQVQSLHGRLHQLAVAGGERSATLIAFLQLAREATGTKVAAFLGRDATGQLALERLDGPANLVPSDALLDCARVAGERGLQQRRTVGDWCLLAQPVAGCGTLPEVVLVVGPESCVELASTRVLPLVATHFSLWQLNQQSSHWRWESEVTAAMLDLVGKLARSESLTTAAQLAANELQRFFRCRQVALGLVSSSAVCRLQAISETPQFDPQSESARQLEGALSEAILRNRLSSWPAAESSPRHALLLHRGLAESQRCEAVVSVPLPAASGKARGALLLTGERHLLSPNMANALRVLAEQLSAAFAGVEQSCRSPWSKLADHLRQSALARPGKILAVCLALLVAIMCLPWQYSVSAPCLVEAESRNVIVAPYTGLVRESHVQPGDRVLIAQPIALMDDREMTWELTAATADRARAEKTRDKAVAVQKIIEAQIAQFETDRHAVRMQLLQERLDHLSVNSPIAGVVIESHLENAVNAPVKSGQPLAEIAPLHPVRVEIALPEEVLAHIAPGMTVELQLEGCDEQRRGQLTLIRPQAELRGGRNVFVGEVLLDNMDEHLRPGMSGHARVLAKWQCLGWIWLHKAGTKLSWALGW